MDINKLPVGTIFMSKNVRLMIVSKNKNIDNNYIVCTCNKDEIITNKLYSINATEIENILSLGYVDINNQVIKPKKTSKYRFDANGIVISDQG